MTIFTLLTFWIKVAEDMEKLCKLKKNEHDAINNDDF